MNRFGLLAIGIGVSLLTGCAHRERGPLLGNWQTKLVSDDGKGVMLAGSMQLYATNDKFTLHLDGAQQGMDVAGTWAVEKSQVQLKVNQLNFDDRGGSDHRDPNRPFVPFDDLRKAFAGTLTVVLGSDRKSFQGPLLTIGSHLGRLTGAKSAQAR